MRLIWGDAHGRGMLATLIQVNTIVTVCCVKCDLEKKTNTITEGINSMENHKSASKSSRISARTVWKKWTE